jgi:hypothetical protein
MHGSCIESLAPRLGAALWASFVVANAQKMVKFIIVRHVFLALFQKHATILAQS